MSTIEFQADVKNGTIEIPEIHKTEFMAQEHVRVIMIQQNQSNSL
jgi:hypothetical protein